MPEPYYNTTNYTGQELAEVTAKAKNQDEMILQFFKQHPYEEFIPFDVQRALNLQNTPITSIRRSMTNLSKYDKSNPDKILPLQKTDHYAKGNYGRRNSKWRLRHTYKQASIF